MAHNKDIVRSYSHEMVHHMQNLQGVLTNIDTTDTTSDNKLLDIEKEAYTLGNITFRNWEDSIKNLDESLWANINAKKKSGKKSSHKNSKAYKAAKKAGIALKKSKNESLISEGSGDCYKAAVNVLMQNTNDGVLVHGMVDGQGKLTGIRFGHAWVELDNKVLDYSNGKKLTLPKKAYYSMGNVEPKECKYYKYKEAATFMLDTGHYGPWEMSGEPIMAEDIPDIEGEIGIKNINPVIITTSSNVI